MTGDEKQEKVSEFRKKAKGNYHGGNGTPDEDGSATGGAGETPLGDAEAGRGPTGTVIPGAAGTVTAFPATGRANDDRPGKLRDSDRGAGGSGGSHRSGSRRRDKSSFGAAHDSAASVTSTGEAGSGTNSVGRLEADGQPFRIDRPDPSFDVPGSSNGAVSAKPKKKSKEDYRRTQRLTERGLKENVYADIDNPDSFISANEYKQLPDKSSTDSDSNSPVTEKTSESRLFGRTQVLTEREARDLLEPFKAALIDCGTYADKGLWLLNPTEANKDIWGDLVDLEAEQLAKPILLLGQKNPVVAVAVRETVHLKDYAALVAILAPRVIRTKRLIETAPPRPRRGARRLFRTVEASA